mmetsp:Transcript_116926/g.376136  ORF Transcript_116926/g.376136 Transcript_116926/m.376136 type:complete len:382 (-) Transcript_116926:381-1526(-)
MCLLDGLLRLLLGDVGVATLDVLEDRRREEHRLLTDIPDEATPSSERQHLQVHAVDRHDAGHRIVEALQELDDRGLARAALADEGHLLALVDCQAQALQDLVVRPRRVREPHVLELDHVQGTDLRGHWQVALAGVLDLGVALDDPLHVRGTALGLSQGQHRRSQVVQRHHADDHGEEHHDDLGALEGLAGRPVDAIRGDHVVGTVPERQGIPPGEARHHEAEGEANVTAGNDPAPSRGPQQRLEALDGTALAPEGGDDADGDEDLLGDGAGLAEPLLLLALKHRELLPEVDAAEAHDRDHAANHQGQLPSLDEANNQTHDELRPADEDLTCLGTNRILDRLNLARHARGQGGSIVLVEPSDVTSNYLFEVLRPDARPLPLR